MKRKLPNLPLKIVRALPFISVKVTRAFSKPPPLAVRILPLIETVAEVGAAGAAVKNPLLTENAILLEVVPAIDCPTVPSIL